MLVGANQEGGPDTKQAVSGAWLLLAEVSAQDPTGPSWQFLQVKYAQTCP